MMIAFRLVFGLLLVAGIVCLAMYAGTGDLRYRRLGLLLVKWTLIAAAGFFAVLIAERLPELI